MLYALIIFFGPYIPHEYIIHVDSKGECIEIYKEGEAIGCGRMQETGCFDPHDEMGTGCNADIVEIRR